MYNSSNKKTETATSVSKEQSEAKSASGQEVNVSETVRNDKRYEEPFEDDGAYANDDDTD